MMGMIGLLGCSACGCNEQVGLAPYNGGRRETCDGDDYMQIVDARGLTEPEPRPGTRELRLYSV
jgi:hypothetical protein